MKRHILNTQTTYFEMTLYVGIAFKDDYSPKVVYITYGLF
jgi:hypothetical protein